jgi:3',5'-cyclic AMP phosphodiesterase CpdA
MKLVIAHVSDIHFGCENAAAVEAVGERLRAEPPDVVLVTGDITQSGRRREFQAARAWLESLSPPTASTPGNHDTPYWDLIARLFRPFVRYDAFIGPPGLGALAWPGLAVASINTARGAQPRANWSKGQVRLADARNACTALAAAGDGLKVVICHHPLMEVTGGPMTGRVWGGVEASRILAEGGVDLILTGHVHMPFAHALPFGDGQTYNVGASTLSLRERGCPAGFNLIEADEDQIQITALGWVGTRFEAQRSWGFDRRRTDKDRHPDGRTGMAAPPARSSPGGAAAAGEETAAPQARQTAPI